MREKREGGRFRKPEIRLHPKRRRPRGAESATPGADIAPRPRPHWPRGPTFDAGSIVPMAPMAAMVGTSANAPA
jgi:hypothetical protein